ncbi:MAG: S-layer homology domain-containing protein [Oscillospiraceae bacterium]|nr:S-layer homology domain-containing protein [Oscillospiraceae bacterium]
MKRKTRFAALLLAVMLLLGLFVSARASESSDAADTLNALGLFRGTGNGYELDREPTRAEALTMLVRLLGKETEALAYAGDCPLLDVAGRWMAPYVGWAYEAGITKGVSGTAFDPDSTASGKMYATFVLRALGYREEEGDFTYEDAVSAAVDLGLAPAAGYRFKFIRADAVLMSIKALETPCKGSDQVLLAKLAAEGAVSAEAAEKTGILPPVWPEDAVTVTVACVGDSLTYGMGTDDPVKQSYPTRLGRITGPYRFVTERYGHSGATVDYDNASAYAGTVEYADSLNTQAELVLLMLGTNDTIFSQHRDVFPQDFEKMVRTYQDLPQHPRVIILLPPHFFSDGPMYADSSKNLEEVIEMEKAVAEEMGLSTIDVYGFTEGHFDWSPDGVHFTAEGYQLLAEFLYENLSALLD